MLSRAAQRAHLVVDHPLTAFVAAAGRVTMTDVSEQARLRAEIAQLKEELHRATRDRSAEEVSETIAHELVQPLLVIGANANTALRWLRRDEPDLGQAEGAISAIVDTVERASEIVRRARANVRRSEPELASLDLNALLAESLALMEGLLREQGVNVTSDLEPGLPSVLGDRVQLQQVVANLVQNAAQAMAGCPIRHLAITSRRVSPETVQVEVLDSGPGIASEDLPRIFDRFFTTKPAGMGVGLSICRSIARAHGGEIEADNAPLGGAVFHLTLPAVPENN